ncbi:AAA domain-containing protein [Mycolicibacterium senegalense]|uniref:AAA domain-containing protein n=1 Tax=Mycolicibacterium senegalense TaxID=1796 RepID=UPI003643AA5B
MAAPQELRSVSASEIGEFVRHDSCRRRFRLATGNRRQARTLPFYERLFNTLDVVLTRSGHDREDQWTQFLDTAGVSNITGERPDDPDAQYPDWQEFVANAVGLAAQQSGYAREVRLDGAIGAFAVNGRADFLLIVWRDGVPVVRVVECKASRRDRTYHRLQVALYRLLILDLLESAPLVVAGVRVTDVEAVVARIDETTNANQDILALDPLNLEMEEADVQRLLADDGTLEAILATDLDDLPYELGAKCDSCVFDVHCFPESARQRRHELLGMRSSSATALRGAGIETIDDLADLDPASEQARTVRADPAFADDLDALIATGVARRTTLPRADGNDGGAAFPVTALPGYPGSQLPQHEFHGERLIRIYLNVDYDYTENRIGALAAHVTASAGTIHPVWEATERSYPDGSPVMQPAAEVVERVVQVDLVSGDDVTVEQPVSGRVVRLIKGSRWTGEYGPDTGAERELIQNFLMELINAIADIAGEREFGGAEDGRARIHFYVWSRAEITQLVEACTRASSSLLAALRELFGCRAELEQLIYSCLQDEVSNRYALGWTSRGLVVASGLTWYGQRFHWTRKISGQAVELDRIFTQDLFDFKTTLAMDGPTTWAQAEQGNFQHRFEIRSRFHDSLPAPYWHALWQTLPDPEAPGFNAQTAAQIRRYHPAGEPNILPGYLEARTQALRWIEERIRFKNTELEKPRLEIADLRRFSLGIDDATAAAVDFLQLDHAVKMTDWVAAHMKPLRTRVTAGRSIPIADLRPIGNNRLVASINLDGHDIALDELAQRTSLSAGSYVRISPHSGEPSRGQTPGQLLRNGKTCIISEIRWDDAQVELEIVTTGQRTRYALQSFGVRDGEELWDHATCDESPSDFVAGKVEARLLQGRGPHARRWFDPHQPDIPEQTPIDSALLDRLRGELDSADLGAGRHLSPDQATAVLEGLSAKVQLLQGPPGTGKTQTTAVSVLSRIALRCPIGSIVLIGATTHTAVDTLLNRIHDLHDPVNHALEAVGHPLPSLRYIRINDNPGEPAPAWRDDIGTSSGVRELRTMAQESTLVIAGTTSGILKLAKYLGSKATWGDNNGLSARVLVIDEASMMVFPHFLALATCTSEGTEILLAGDHRQLSPILANDWESEDRPPSVTYQPFVSAYNAVLQIANAAGINPHRAVRTALALSFRLPQQIIDLIARLYRLDAIELRGLARPPSPAPEKYEGTDPLAGVWAGAGGLFLVLHDEHESRTSNAFEVHLVQQVVAAGQRGVGEVAVITPHRAQRTLLTRELNGAVDVVDTVERLQGGERPTVIVSGTASEPNAIGANAEFLLNLNRSNVAFSRSQERLIVVCAKTLLDHIPAELEAYQDTLLWKSLRTICSEFVAGAVIDGHDVQVWTVPDIAASTVHQH